MSKPTVLRADADELGVQVGRVRDVLTQIESCYNDIDASVRELCTTEWVSSGSADLLRQFETSTRVARMHLRRFKRFYTESLSWASPQYSVLDETIADEIKALVKE